MKQLIIKPCDWSVDISECPSGFFVYNEQLCFKDDYDKEYNSAGEYFVAKDVIVQPVNFEWEDI